MEITEGSCRIGLWHVHVRWSDTTVYRVRFSTTGIPGPVPALLQKYCASQPVDLSLLDAEVLHGNETYSRVYREARKIPYGSTATYGEIARRAGTHPRVVGQAMARNPVALVIPCHRVVAAGGVGGFSPSVEIKQELLRMEKRGLRKLQLARGSTVNK